MVEAMPVARPTGRCARRLDRAVALLDHRDRRLPRPPRWFRTGNLLAMSPQPRDSSLPEDQHAWGFGLATVADDGTVLDTWFPAPELGEAPGGNAPESLTALAGKHPERRVHTDVVTVTIALAEPPADASDAYLRLHLLSHRLVRPHEVNVDGIFGKLANVVWTSAGPCAVADFEEVRLGLRAQTGRCRSSASTSSPG